MVKKKRVIVGMSGGVDSSVCAALLKAQGYEVIGVTMQLLPKEEERKSACCNLGAVNDAKRVAHKLGIAHYSVNSRDAFQENVISHFIESYATGHTPNPCVECNRTIKFDEMWQMADELKADFMATGHYCKRGYDEARDVYTLEKAVDSSKDQTYFLYVMTQEKLRKTLFPLGGLLKTDIRKMAEEMELINANKPDSQEICFVSSKSYKDYVKANIPDARRIPGDIVDLEGKVLGRHSGIYQFTIGQRKGLQLGSENAMYVLKIDAATQQVIVGDKADLRVQELSLNQVNLIDETEDIVGKTFDLKLRYQMVSIHGTVLGRENGTLKLSLEADQDGVATGQSCVFYDGDRVVGGGVVK